MDKKVNTIICNSTQISQQLDHTPSNVTNGNGNIVNSIINLPNEIIWCIFSFLSLKNFCNMACLSSHFYQLCKNIRIQTNTQFIGYVENARDQIEQNKGRFEEYTYYTSASGEEGVEGWEIRWVNCHDFITVWNNLPFKMPQLKYLSAKPYPYQKTVTQIKMINGFMCETTDQGNAHQITQIFFKKVCVIGWYLLFNLNLNIEDEKLLAVKTIKILLDLFFDVSKFKCIQKIDLYSYTKNILDHIAYLPENFSVKLELLFTQLVDIHLDMAIQLAHCFTFGQEHIIWKIIQDKLNFPNKEIIIQKIKTKSQFYSDPQCDFSYLQKGLAVKLANDFHYSLLQSGSIDDIASDYHLHHFTLLENKKSYYKNHQLSENIKAQIDFFKTLLTNDSGIEQYQGFYESLLFNTNCLALKDIFELLIQKNVNVNVIDDSGNTLLIKAIIEQETEIALLLLQQPKIDIALTNKLGKTAKDYLSQLPSSDNKTLIEKSLTELEKKSIS